MRRLNVILLALTLFISQTLFANEPELISDVINEPVVEATEQGPVEVIQSTINITHCVGFLSL